MMNVCLAFQPTAYKTLLLFNILNICLQYNLSINPYDLGL